MKILGIDNGLDGGLVCVDAEGHLLHKQIMPAFGVKKKGKNKKGESVTKNKREYDMSALLQIFDLIKPDHVVIERAQAMPGQGVTSMFSIGLGFGLMKGIVAGLRLPVTIVAPQAWQKWFFIKGDKDTKGQSYLACTRLWPGVDWKATERCSTAHDGMTDAALIAEYGRRIISGTVPQTFQGAKPDDVESIV